MNKSRRIIEYVGNVSESEIELSSLSYEADDEIVIKGNINLSKKLYIPCNLSVKGKMDCQVLIVDGNLKVEGSINFSEIHVTKDFYFKGSGRLDGGDIIVDKDCYYEGEAETTFSSLTVNGILNFKEKKQVNGKKLVWQMIEGMAMKISRNYSH